MHTLPYAKMIFSITSRKVSSAMPRFDIYSRRSTGEVVDCLLFLVSKVKQATSVRVMYELDWVKV